jgi:serine/threonine protein kinase
VKTPGFTFPVVTGRTYAVKLIQKKFIMEKKNKEIVFRERKILEKLKHPFIVTLHYTFQTDPALSARLLLPFPSPPSSPSLPLSPALAAPLQLTSASRRADFVMDYCANGELYEHIRKVPTPLLHTISRLAPSLYQVVHLWLT